MRLANDRERETMVMVVVKQETRLLEATAVGRSERLRRPTIRDVATVAGFLVRPCRE